MITTTVRIEWRVVDCHGDDIIYCHDRDDAETWLGYLDANRPNAPHAIQRRRVLLDPWEPA